MLASLLIMLREGFEAALVIAILYSYLRRTGRAELLGPLWAGIGAAFVVVLALGVAVHLGMDELVGVARQRAFAATMLLAAGVLTWMIFWMRKHSRAMKGELEGSLDHAIDARSNVKVAVVAAAFLAVLREGFEATLFLIATATQESGENVLVGGIVGLVVAGVLGWMVVVGGKRLPMKHFFTVTAWVLVIFAAGLLARAVMFLQSTGDLGIVLNNVYDLTAVHWLTQDSEVGRFLAAMFGWDPRPSIEQVLVWVGYVGIVGWLFQRGGRATATKGTAKASVRA
ncbi:FTR1 family iron permease [Oryzihumus leptocrescens]|uniref:High-affinity iron transporter n=1 Tax=Oryzihumus leptocrescens TaxID=297536 RepID=A0A542Z959_9MICO|nr:FTR1 family protein [Oryzihumus leptocrescens]TQL56832.1 high-affinity iron transporter [Oryzihumus leptocrescens]